MPGNRELIRQAEIIRDVQRVHGIARNTACKLIKEDPTFPKPVRDLNQKSRWWLKSEYETWKGMS
jgi:predicted DNA-binding transcriptional regulator AlpA